MENLSTEVREGMPARPRLLSVVCILSFISGGSNFISSMVIFSFPDFYRQGVEMAGKMFSIPNWKDLLAIPQIYFLITAVLFVGSVTGAIGMWKLRKEGFHIYTISQILMILASMFFFNMAVPGWPEVIITTLFVYLYSRFLKIMS